ncbi:MAG: hypothetical protein ACFFCQ_09510 [Promethearchaeota archaeon]
MKKIIYIILISNILLISLLGCSIQTSFTLITPKPIEEPLLKIDSILPKKPGVLSSNITEIDPLPENTLGLNLSEVFIDIEISGEIPNNTQIWAGCYNKSPSLAEDTNFVPSHEVLLTIDAIKQIRDIHFQSSVKESYNAYDLGFKEEHMIPSRENVWYLRIENSVNGTQQFFDWKAVHPNRTDYYQPKGWLEQFSLRYGAEYAFRSLLHPCIMYGIDCTVELTRETSEFITFPISPPQDVQNRLTRSNWDDKHNKTGTNILGAALIVATSHCAGATLNDMDDHSSIVLEGLLMTGKYEIYYMIEGDAKYACANYSDGYFFEAPDVLDGLEKLDNETEPGDIAIVRIGGHGGDSPPGIQFHEDSYIYYDDLKNKLMAINTDNEKGDVPIFCWLCACGSGSFSPIVESNNITNSIMWYQNSTYPHNVSKTPNNVVYGSVAFATNLNYAFYSIEELFNTTCTYPITPKWWDWDYVSENKTYTFWWNNTILSWAKWRNNTVGMRSNYNNSGFFLNPHTAQFEKGCWEYGYNLTDGSAGRYYSTSLSNYPTRRDISANESLPEPTCYLRYVGVRYTFTKNWDSNLNARLNARATSNCGGNSPVTNLYARIYDEHGNYVYDSQRTIYKRYDKDSGWNIKDLKWDNNHFIPGHRYQLIFYFADSWAAYISQKIRINETLIISESAYTATMRYFDEFESSGYLNVSWPQVEQTCQGTAYFEKSESYKRFGSYSAKHYSIPQTGDGYSTERWNDPGVHTEGILEGWIYRDHFSYWAYSDIHILFNDSNNHYYLRFYKNRIYLRKKINGVTETLGSTVLPFLSGTGWQRKWWWFRVTLVNKNTFSGNDTLIAHVKEARASSMTTLGLFEVNGDLSTGYVALRSRLGQFGSCYYDDVKFVNFNSLSNGGFEGAANLTPWETLFAERSLTKYSGSYGCKLHEYDSYWQTYQDGSIWQNVCIPISMIANFSFYMKSSSSDATVNVTITVDGETTQMWSFNNSSDWVQRVIDGNDLIQGTWITEIKIEQYGCPTDSGAFIDEVAFFYD